MPNPVSQTSSGFFHSFGGCFGIVAAILVMIFAPIIGCIFLEGMATAVLLNEEKPVVERTLMKEASPANPAVKSAEAKTPTAKPIEKPVKIEPALLNPFALGNNVDCAPEADKDDFIRRKQESEDAELYLAKSTILEVVSEDKSNGLLLVRKFGKTRRFWIWAEDVRRFR